MTEYQRRRCRVDRILAGWILVVLLVAAALAVAVAWWLEVVR